MSEGTGADRVRRTRLLLGHSVRAWRRRGARLVWGLTRLGVRSPGRLLIAPPDIRTADPTVAADIYAGYFVFDGKAVNTHGRSPFLLAPPSAAWAEALAGFGWLRHLRAADTALARVNARALVGDWIAQMGRPRDVPAWTPETAARRLLAWLSQSPIILDGADRPFYRAFMLSLGLHAAFLRGALFAGLSGEAPLLVAIALTELSLCADTHAKLRRQAVGLLIEETTARILPDGGHVSRNPAVPVDLLLYLLPLRQAFVAAGEPVPPALMNAIDRMIPLVRSLRHGDGALALFNGMGATRPDVLATLLAYDDMRGPPLLNMRQSGFQRLEAQAAVVLFDSGLPPPPAFSRRAHAGTLAFEFSVGAQHLIVNCGAPDRGPPQMREAARTTAAHSTLVLADRSSSRFFAGGPCDGLIYAGPRSVPLRRGEDGGSIVVEASHDGYEPRFGVLHRRRLSLAAAGDRLSGEDQVVTPVPRQRLGRRRPRRAYAFALRFHLHPSLRVEAAREGAAALILCPGGERWLFEAGGEPVRIEESIAFAGADGTRRAEQLVVAGHSRTAPAIAWSLSRWEAEGPA